MLVWKFLRGIGKPVVRLQRSRVYCQSYRMCSSEGNNSAPVKYSMSRASQWKAEYSRKGSRDDEMPSFQPFVVVLSVGAFLLYFCVLREENDLDEALGVSLYDRIEGLEESQLRLSLSYYREKGMDTKDIERRLRELEAERGKQ